MTKWRNFQTQDVEKWPNNKTSGYKILKNGIIIKLPDIETSRYRNFQILKLPNSGLIIKLPDIETSRYKALFSGTKTSGLRIDLTLSLPKSVTGTLPP